MNDHTVARQWASRPADERFTSLDDLRMAVSSRYHRSDQVLVAPNDIRILQPTQQRPYLGFDCDGEEVAMTHWSFGQLARYAQVPADYCRRIPAELAAINLQWGIDHAPRESVQVLKTRGNGSIGEVRAITSDSYGRIWDEQVVNAVIAINGDGRWEVPSALGHGQGKAGQAGDAVTNNSTTLYASDRDVFIFLVDPRNPIDVNGDVFYRGFYTWNSEVGAAVFGLATFLYRAVCHNRIIWGQTQYQEVRIRHSAKAPERFRQIGHQMLREYADSSADSLISGLRTAKQTQIAASDDEFSTWLLQRGFNSAQTKGISEMAISEEGQNRTVMDAVNGISAYARRISHTDARVDMERKAGEILSEIVN